MSNLKLVATCLFGLEKLVGEEIDALGCRRRETIDGRVYFEGPASAVARANINLRCAERVLIELASFEATTFSALFDGVKRIAWEKIIGLRDAFPVKGHSVKSDLVSIPDCQRIIKKAVVERLKETYAVDWFEESANGVKYQIEFFILNNRAVIMLDTSGAPLHKRGYRPESNIAPIRETLAAGMVKLSRPREDVILWDPFCGSGTIAIEAALLMTNTAPGIARHFSAERYPWLPERIWREAREEAAKNRTPDTRFRAIATDIDPESIEIARDNIRRAGMWDYIDCFTKDALTIRRDDRRTTIVCNPPYGERMDTVRQARALYQKMGKVFSKLSPWQIYIITSEEDFETLYGRRADKVRRLYNGMIRCNYYQYFKNDDRARRPESGNGSHETHGKRFEKGTLSAKSPKPSREKNEKS